VFYQGGKLDPIVLPRRKVRSEGVLLSTKVRSEGVLPRRKVRSDGVLPSTKVRSESVLPRTKDRSEGVLPRSKVRSEGVLPRTKVRPEGVLPRRKVCTEMTHTESIIPRVLSRVDYARGPSSKWHTLRTPPDLPSSERYNHVSRDQSKPRVQFEELSHRAPY
jgi:hypothetical protein